MCAQLEAVWFCLTYHSAAHHSLHPLPRGTTQGPGRSPALLPAGGTGQTKGRVSAGPISGATRKRCGKVLLEAEGKQTRQVLSPRCFPWPPSWKNSNLPRNLKESLKGHSSISCNKTYFYTFDFQQLDFIVLFIYNLCMWCFRQGGQGSGEGQQFWLLGQ